MQREESQPRSPSKTNLLPWLLGGAGCLVLLCCGGTGIVGVGWWLSQSSDKAEDKTGGQSRLPSLLRGKGEEDREKEEFLRFARGNAQDPSGLEIVEWGEKKDGSRRIRFRCKLIAIKRGGAFIMPGKVEKGGEPILLDDATIFYSPDGKIKRVMLERCFLSWYAR